MMPTQEKPMHDTPVDGKITPHTTGNNPFGKWTVLEYAGKHRANAINGCCSVSDQWLCRCACGREQLVLRWNLLMGRSTQCKQCFGTALGQRRKDIIDPDSKRQNLAIAGKYRRIDREGHVAAWDWLGFLTWFRPLDASQTIGPPRRHNPEQPHGPDNTYFEMHPIRTGHIAVIAEMAGMSVEEATSWAGTVTRQAVEQRANILRSKKAGGV